VPIHYLTESDVREVLTMDLALKCVEDAFRKMALDEATNIPRQRCQTDAAMLHVLPAAAKTLGALGLKAYTTGRFEAKFQVFLFDPKQGGLTAIIEADHLGAVRTGAASGVATKKLARAGASTLGLYGTGKQARTQLEAIARVRALSRVHVFSRDAGRRAAFAEAAGRELGLDVRPVDDPELAARDLDIVVTATTSREPVLRGDWLAEGSHVNAIGSNMMSKAEIDPEVIRRSSIVTIDSKEQGKLECGDFAEALSRGLLTWSDVKEFAPVFVGRYPGRQSEGDITLFKSLGLGIEDLAVAVAVVDRAKSRGLGQFWTPEGSTLS